MMAEAERDRVREMRLIGMGQPSSLMYRDERAWTYDVSGLGFRYHLVVSLPLHSSMTPDARDRVVDAVRSFVP
jgi:hypothetical protein